VGSYDHYKKDVLECGQWLSGHGYFGALRGTGGNVSLRVEGEEVVAFSRSKVSYGDLISEDICIVVFDMKVIEG
jgi:ribulose-5-phosphate 4-epimerase/fuculose-1-phosphate aldolase